MKSYYNTNLKQIISNQKKYQITTITTNKIQYIQTNFYTPTYKLPKIHITTPTIPPKIFTIQQKLHNKTLKIKTTKNSKTTTTQKTKKIIYQNLKKKTKTKTPIIQQKTLISSTLTSQ